MQTAIAEPPLAIQSAQLLQRDDIQSRHAVDKLNADLRESEQRYRALFELGPVAVYSIDTSGVIQNFNRRAAELWGREPALGDTDERFCGSYKLFRPDGSYMPHAECPMALVVSGAMSAAHDAEVIIERPDGSRVTVIVNIRPLKNERGEITGAINCFYDITERKQAEEKLEQTVADRTAKLREMVRELEHMSYAIIHDMRAPLRAMTGFADYLEAGSDKITVAERNGCLRRISVAAARLDQLIQDALNYNRTVLQEAVLCPVEVDPLVRGIVETYPNLGRDKADIEIEGRLPLVNGNEALLTQCFSNLLGNAVKFVKPGVRAHVRIRPEPGAQSGRVRIWVEDNGIGIAENGRQRIFQMFERLAPGYEGTGMGLAVVKKVVERMRGRIGVESDPGKGSRFWVELETAPVEA